MTKYEIELSDSTADRIRKIAEAINEGFFRNSLTPGEKAAILGLARQLPPPVLPDGVYVYRGDKYMSPHFVKDGKHSSSMEVDTGRMSFALDVLLDSTKNWTRIGDLPEVDNGNSVSG